MKTIIQIVEEAREVMRSIAVPCGSKYKWSLSIDNTRPTGFQVWCWEISDLKRMDALRRALEIQDVNISGGRYLVLRLSK
jgi:hypothetical protein